MKGQGRATKTNEKSLCPRRMNTRGKDVKKKVQRSRTRSGKRPFDLRVLDQSGHEEGDTKSSRATAARKRATKEINNNGRRPFRKEGANTAENRTPKASSRTKRKSQKRSREQGIPKFGPSCIAGGNLRERTKVPAKSFTNAVGRVPRGGKRERLGRKRNQ